MKKKPLGFIAVCIMAIVLSGLGVVTCLLMVAGIVMESNMQVGAQAEKQDNTKDALQTMQAKIKAVNARWRPIQVALMLLQVVLIAGLLLGGILGLLLKPLGKTLLTVSFWCAIPFEIIRLVVTIALQLETFPIMQEMMKGLQSKGNAAAGGDGFAAIMMGSMIFGLIIGVVWFLVKLALYLWGALYLRKQEIVELFKPEDPFGAQDPYSMPGFGR